MSLNEVIWRTKVSHETPKHRTFDTITDSQSLVTETIHRGTDPGTGEGPFCLYFRVRTNQWELQSYEVSKPAVITHKCHLSKTDLGTATLQED